MNRKVKIVATIGPASQEDAVIEKLLQAGMDVARLNFSHGTHETHAARISQLRAISTRLGRPLAVLQDLQGPKIRVGVLPAPLTLVPGQKVLLYPEGGSQPQTTKGQALIPVDFPQLFDSVKPGNRILLDDGRLVLSVLSVRKKVVAEVQTGGVLTSNKGINLPGVLLDIPAFTEKDAEDLKFGLSLGVDFVAISFVRRAEDLQAGQAGNCLPDPSGLPAVDRQAGTPGSVG